MLEDIVIPEDPFYLVKYRSFHNHELCTNTIAYHSYVGDEELHRKGAVRILPQGCVAVQELSTRRRKEILEEGKVDKMPIPYEVIGSTTVIYKS